MYLVLFYFLCNNLIVINAKSLWMNTVCLFSVCFVKVFRSSVSQASEHTQTLTATEAQLFQLQQRQPA